MMTVSTFAAVLILASIPLIVSRLEILDRNAQVWKSFSGGVGIAYAFVVLLPKLAKVQAYLAESTESVLSIAIPHLAYLIAICGVMTYYGVDVIAANVDISSESDSSKRALFLVYLHGCGISAYFFLISFIMLEGSRFESSGLPGVVVFGVAMAIHYLSIVHTLRKKYDRLYDRFMGPTYAGIILAGWILAFFIDIPVPALAAAYAFFAGALLLFVLHEKLPDRRYFRFLPYAAGGVLYTALLLLSEIL